MKTNVALLSSFALFLALCSSALASLTPTYQEQVVAAVLMGEARGEGNAGLIAVAEVMQQRCTDKKRTPLQIATQQRKGIHIFSCLNDTTPKQLIQRYERHELYTTALQVAAVLCRAPEKFQGIAKGATHYSNVKERPWWARGHKPVVVIGQHAFYRDIPY